MAQYEKLEDRHIKLTVTIPAEDFRQAIEQATHDPEIGVLLITEHLAGQYADLIAPYKLTAHTPLVVEIPDRHSTGRSSDSITRYIREAIGVKL